jgi:hypothetical protein
MAYSPRTFSFLQNQRHQMVNSQQQKTIDQQLQNQVKIKLYFNFNHFYCNSDLCSLITRQFFNKIEKIINSVYLKLILKDIDDTRKWNSCLELNDNLAAEDIDDQNLDNSNVQTNFECDCVWSVSFKLHRLHQSAVHKLQYADGGLDLSAAKQRAGGESTGSLGLKKLKECLNNFKIDDTPMNNDIYVYKRNNEIYLLTLKEIYSTTENITSSQDQFNQASANKNNNNNDILNSTGNNETSTASIPSAVAADESLPLNFSHSMDDYEQTTGSVATATVALGQPASSLGQSHNETTLSRQSSNIVISRRQSSANVDDFKSKSSIFNPTMIAGSMISQQQQQSNVASSVRPDSIKLCLYGLNEPDDEFKQELCKMLQMELDHWLLVKICSSIERNSYKTASMQHPDRLVDEDIVFLKQIADSYNDFELSIPFIFNLNKTLRDYFFYYVRHIFNINFKSMDVYSATTGQQQQAKAGLLMPNKLANNSGLAMDSGSPLLGQHHPFVSPIHDQLSTAKITPHQHAVSFVTTHPTLGSSFVDQLIHTNELQYLCRVFFHNNNRIISHIGKNTSISLVLVECLYAPKG